ncbi:hypothetical protein [Phormidesmis sp. 146-33]
MDTRFNLTSQPKQVPTGHMEPLYINSNCCTLQDTVQQLTIDTQADTPFIVWLLERPRNKSAGFRDFM